MKPWLDDGDVRLFHGDVVTTLQGLPAGIAQTCITSPPYWGLRSYLDDGHDDKHAELGLEPSPDAYVERMVGVFREVWRVLRSDGTVWCNLGDSFLPGKQLAGVPWRVAFALQADGWYLRSDIVWSKPNPMPESVSDRPTKAHEYLFLLSKQPRYFYDSDAIREPHTDSNGSRRDAQEFHGTTTSGDTVPGAKLEESPYRGQAMHRGLHGIGTTFGGWSAAGRNRRSVWTIPTEPFPEAHFATYPQELVRPCIQAGTSERGECVECGAPRIREIESSLVASARKPDRQAYPTPRGDGGGDQGAARSSSHVAGLMKHVETTGWRASCSCDAPTRPQLVLDPFIGSGTTALVARKHGRRCIGIDLSSEYLDIAARRLSQLSLFAEPA